MNTQVSHLQKPEKCGDAIWLAATKQLYYCHSEMRNAEAILSEDGFASGPFNYEVVFFFASLVLFVAKAVLEPL
ncbi:MAG: hypothetical protein KAJ05_02570 [Candidatus Latescibacteria bacterium]|nr:hypothetical protein [Candidatus Latescibacterota bacterium]MCK5327295.1 hypothetical protein [Candidatus Latescibacterota bacterium]MCK5381461.1 hypothetical protein [Candidatus Latescibacterota bacterium]MCK5526002.1 hypothetical protein [Candidatus Latescibacterota bacterium]